MTKFMRSRADRVNEEFGAQFEIDMNKYLSVYNSCNTIIQRGIANNLLALIARKYTRYVINVGVDYINKLLNEGVVYDSDGYETGDRSETYGILHDKFVPIIRMIDRSSTMIELQDCENYINVLDEKYEVTDNNAITLMIYYVKNCVEKRRSALSNL